MPKPPPVDLRPWFLTLGDLGEGLLDWRQFWEHEGPIELDIGCGRGLFLLTAALAQPQRNYLGIELSYKEGRRAARRLAKRQLPNARVLGGDAGQVLRERLAMESIASVHVYYPDPWWKRRHRKRRVFSEELVGQIARVLVPGGHLYIRTDVAEYFDVMCSLVQSHGGFLRRTATFDTIKGQDKEHLTSFERKARIAGSEIYHAAWQKVVS